MSEYLQENAYVIEETKPQVLTHLTNVESDFESLFRPNFLNMNGSEIHLQLQSVTGKVTFL
jgi:hypothetical protein